MEGTEIVKARTVGADYLTWDVGSWEEFKNTFLDTLTDDARYALVMVAEDRTPDGSAVVIEPMAPVESRGETIAVQFVERNGPPTVQFALAWGGAAELVRRALDSGLTAPVAVVMFGPGSQTDTGNRATIGAIFGGTADDPTPTEVTDVQDPSHVLPWTRES